MKKQREKQKMYKTYWSWRLGLWWESIREPISLIIACFLLPFYILGEIVVKFLLLLILLLLGLSGLGLIIVGIVHLTT